MTTAAQYHEFARRSLSQVLISHGAYPRKKGVFREAKAAGSGPRSFTTSKAGDVPYSSARLAFELKTASAAPAAMKGKGFLPATVRPRLSRMLTGLLLASRLATASCSTGEYFVPRANKLSGHRSTMIQQGGGSPSEGTPTMNCHTAGLGENGRSCSIYHGCTFRNA